MDSGSNRGIRKRLLAAAVLVTVLLTAGILDAPAARAQGGDDAAGECATKYPIVLVHGAGFRDTNAGINYWGRIPEYLEVRGAKICYGKTDGWGTVEENAVLLKARVEVVLAETGSEKVNIIAHSKGGLEARYMISSLGMEDKVASLTTISTPHGGSKVMDDILGVPDFLLRAAALPTNLVRRIADDKNPDFYSGIQSLGRNYTKGFNAENPDRDGVYYQSFAGELWAPASDLLLSWPAYWIKSVDGPNDGMVTVESAKWTNFRGVLRGTGYRGVSHMDEVDFRREDLEIEPLLGATTVRGFYGAMVADLKQMGY